MQGSIPEELYNLENLRQMDLNDNELTGTISENIGNLLQMSFFQIENNLFTGMVPSQIGSLVQLGTFLRSTLRYVHGEDGSMKNGYTGIIVHACILSAAATSASTAITVRCIIITTGIFKRRTYLLLTHPVYAVSFSFPLLQSLSLSPNI